MDLYKLKVEELRELAAKNEVAVFSSMKKADLIEALEQSLVTTAPPEVIEESGPKINDIELHPKFSKFKK